MSTPTRTAAAGSRRPRRISAGRNSSPTPNCRPCWRARWLNNRDLRIATLNVEAARAQYRIQRAELVPAIDAQGTSNNQRVPARSVADGAERAHSHLFRRVRSSSAFELDLFGRVRSLRSAALEDYFRLEENAHRRATAAGVGSRQCLADVDRGSRAAAAGARKPVTASASPTT